MAYGRYLEEFAVGQVLTHWPGRTITEADCTWFALLTMNQHPVHSDAHYAATHTQHKQRLVPGPLVFSIGIGMTVADISGKAVANLEIEKITHDAPTFIGDTIYAESTVLALRESSAGDRGTVTIETRVTNQRGERVMTFPAHGAGAEEEPPDAGRRKASRVTRPPLDGLRILTVSQFGAGPFGTMLLAFQSFNRGKKSITLDLEHPGGQAVLRDLARVSQAVYNNPWAVTCPARWASPTRRCGTSTRPLCAVRSPASAPPARARRSPRGTPVPSRVRRPATNDAANWKRAVGAREAHRPPSYSRVTLRARKAGPTGFTPVDWGIMSAGLPEGRVR